VKKTNLYKKIFNQFVIDYCKFKNKYDTFSFYSIGFGLVLWVLFPLFALIMAIPICISNTLMIPIFIILCVPILVYYIVGLMLLCDYIKHLRNKII
jgi:hypothetical protein